MDGAILLNKPAGITSFGALEDLQRGLRQKTGLKRKELPSMGHGGTLDPFATGLLFVCVGRGVKLARYLLGSRKTYEAILLFGQTTVPGDPTSPVTETSTVIPGSLEDLRRVAHGMTLQPYLQMPPMHSAKKIAGKPLYELAHQGIDIARDAVQVQLYEFSILSYEAPRAQIRVSCSSGTYIRTLAQDFGRLLGTVAMLETLKRVGSGTFQIEKSCTLEEVATTAEWNTLTCWVPFDQILSGYPRIQATAEETQALVHGKQEILPVIMAKLADPAADCVAVYLDTKLVSVMRRENGVWKIERVFPPGDRE